MKADAPIVPVYPTLSPAAAFSRNGQRWRSMFPFSEPGGRWAFSGRVALFHGLKALRLPERSTILAPSYHEGVEIETLLAAGHRVRYYRVDERLVIDLADVERRLDRDVSALHLTHYFGFAQPVDDVLDFCRAHGLRLIEDCALSLFSRSGDVWLGSRGDLAIFSVYKTLPLPHGGYWLTRDGNGESALPPAPLSSTLIQTLDLLHQHVRASQWHTVERWVRAATRAGARLLRWKRTRTVTSGGSNWDPRLLTYGASAWVPWLVRSVDPVDVVVRRRSNYMRLVDRLRRRLACPFPELSAGVCPLFLPVFVDDKLQFMSELAARGVGSVNLWSRSHPTCPPDLAAEMEPWRRYCLELPIHQGLSMTQVDRVAESVLEVADRVGQSTASAPDGGEGRRPSFAASAS